MAYWLAIAALAAGVFGLGMLCLWLHMQLKQQRELQAERDSVREQK